MDAAMISDQRLRGEEDEEKHCSDSNQHGDPLSADELWISGLDRAEFYPPANSHNWDCNFEEKETYDSCQA